jgi:hypothetical protein
MLAVFGKSGSVISRNADRISLAMGSES